MPLSNTIAARPAALRFAPLFVLLASFAACDDEPPAKTPHQNPLTARAAFDLNCPAAQLRYTDLGNKVWGVSGCGARATYLRRCDQTYFRGVVVDEDCAWVLNGAVLRQEAAAPPTFQAAPKAPEQDDGK